MKRLAFLLWLLAAGAASAQTYCPTRPVGDNSEACASTAYVDRAVGTGGGGTGGGGGTTPPDNSQVSQDFYNTFTCSTGVCTINSGVLRAQDIPALAAAQNVPTVTPEAYGAPASGNATTAINSAFASGRQVSFLPRDYVYTADTLDPNKIGLISPSTTLSDVYGNSLIKDRNGRIIGYAFNHQEIQTYTGGFPSTTPAANFTGGNIIAPPVSQAAPVQSVDIVAQWYGNWGLEWHRDRTGIANQDAYNWWDGGWNFRRNQYYDPQRQSIMGHYKGENPNVLDWQAYWLREAGVRVIVPVSFNLDVGTWGQTDDDNKWVYTLFNTPNFKGLQYIPWARSANFKNTTTSSGAPSDATSANITTQWQNLYYALRPAYPNNYITIYGGRTWFSVYVWDMNQLRALFDGAGSSSTNFSNFLAARASEVIANQGVSGIAVYCHNCTTDAVQPRGALQVRNVLIIPMPYGGPVDSDTSSSDYSGIVDSYAPNATDNRVLSISTALFSKYPIPANDTYKYPGSTPALFRELLRKAIRYLNIHKNRPQMVSIYNVSEWSEGGPGLQPNLQDGWGYLDAIRQAAAQVANATNTTKFALPLAAGWGTFNTTNETATYFKDALGIVHLAGTVKGGTTTTGTTVAILPEGFRPRLTENFPVYTSGGTIALTVQSGGNINLNGAASSAALSFSGISFRVD